jgi:uncharacterized membrane protein
VQIVSPINLIQAVLIIAYPICCHFAVTLGEPQLQLLALLLLSLGLTFKGILQKSGFSLLVMAAITAISLAVYLLGQARAMLYLPPVALPLLMWSVFYRTLGKDQIPLLTRMAKAVHGELSPALQTYTRQVTAAWSYLFAAMTVFSALLPLVASEAVWSLCTNFLNWGVIGIVFIGEFIYRQWTFRSIDQPNFWQYLLIVLRADIKNIE